MSDRIEDVRTRAMTADSTETAPAFRERDSGPARPFSVKCLKSDGAWREFDRYTTRAEAHAIAARLTSIGCAARVVAAC